MILIYVIDVIVCILNRNHILFYIVSLDCFLVQVVITNASSTGWLPSNKYLFLPVLDAGMSKSGVGWGAAHGATSESTLPVFAHGCLLLVLALGLKEVLLSL